MPTVCSANAEMFNARMQTTPMEEAFDLWLVDWRLGPPPTGPCYGPRACPHGAAARPTRTPTMLVMVVVDSPYPQHTIYKRDPGNAHPTYH